MTIPSSRSLEQVDEAPPRLPENLVPPPTPAEAPAGVRSPTAHALQGGDALSAAAASAITGERRTNVVVVAGMPRSGKSTLLSGLYTRFLYGPFAGFEFSESETIREFEAMCYLSRNDSGRSIADTDRTPPAQSRFLHLKLMGPARSVVDLLFSDLTGESFRMMRVDADFARTLAVIGRADHFVVLIDGEKLLSTERHTAAADSRAILSRTLELGLLTAGTSVTAVVSKWDRLLLGLGENEANARVEAARTVLQPWLDRVPNSRWQVLSVRDQDGEPAKDPTQLETLVVEWCKPTTSARVRVGSGIRVPRPRIGVPYLDFGDSVE